MAPLTTDLVIDCAEPLALAEFWVAALDWSLLDNHDLVTQLLADGYVEESETVTDAQGRLYFAGFVAIHHPEAQETPRWLFHRVPEVKTMKNRLHVDVNVGRDAVDEHVQRLVALGAAYVDTFDRPEGYWAAMRDPEGNEFDVH